MPKTSLQQKAENVGLLIVLVALALTAIKIILGTILN